MYEDITIVSGGDTKYFDLLYDLAKSIRSQNNGNKLKIAYLDGGLTSNNIDILSKLNISVLDPGWRHPYAEKRNKGRDYLKINIAKVHLDKIFPESKILIWIDADAWMQNLNALDLFSVVAKKNKFAVVSQASRLQTNHVSFKKHIGKFVELRNIIYKNARRAGIPSKILPNLMGRPTLNAGAYALHVNAPHWERFRHWQNIALKKGRLFTSDQLVFGLTIYEDGLPYEALPDICNYMGPWRWCSKREIFVDYYAPYDPVSVVHLVGQDKMRKDLSHKIEMQNLNDKIIHKSLRFSERFK